MGIYQQSKILSVFRNDRFMSCGEERDSSWPFASHSLTEELILTAVLQEEQVGKDLNYFTEGNVSL